MTDELKCAYCGAELTWRDTPSLIEGAAVCDNCAKKPIGADNLFKGGYRSVGRRRYKQITIRLDTETQRRLKIAAARRKQCNAANSTLTDLVNEILAAYFDK